MKSSPIRVETPEKKNPWTTRVVMSLVLLFSIGLIWWSVNKRLLPVVHEAQKKTQEVSALANEVQQLELKWTPADISKTEKQFKDSKKSLLSGDAGRMNLNREIQQQARALSFNVDIQPGNTEPLPTAGYKLALMLTTIDVYPSAVSSLTNTPYARLLNFTKMLSELESRTDFLELSVTSDTNSVHQATAVVQLWSEGDEAP